MFLVVLTLFTVTLFVVGIAFIYRGYVNTPRPEEIVPSAELERTRAQLSQAQEEEGKLKQQLDTLAVQLEQTQSELGDAQKSDQELRELKAKEQDILAQMTKMKADLGLVAAKADSQAQKAIAVINALLAEKEELEAEVKKADSKIDPEDVAQLNTDNQQLKDRVQESLDKIKELESALVQAQEQAEKARTQEGQTVQDLENENQSLKEGLLQINSRIAEVEAEFQGRQAGESQSVAQASAYLEELSSTKTEIESLRQEIAALQGDKDRYEQKVRELETRPPVTVPGAGTPPADTARILREKEELENGIRQLKEVNRHLMEKEKKLSFELGRSRTQALGLQKICQGLKNDLEHS